MPCSEPGTDFRRKLNDRAGRFLPGAILYYIGYRVLLLPSERRNLLAVVYVLFLLSTEVKIFSCDFVFGSVVGGGCNQPGHVFCSAGVGSRVQKLANRVNSGGSMIITRKHA